MKTFEETEKRGKDFDQRIIPSVIIFLISFFIFSCGSSAKRNDNTPLDTIPEVQIGDQVWMARTMMVLLSGTETPSPRPDPLKTGRKRGKPPLQHGVIIKMILVLAGNMGDLQLVNYQ